MVPSIKCEKFGDIGKKWAEGTGFQTEGKLDIKIFKKPQNAFMYVYPMTSEHPKTCSNILSQIAQKICQK
jgi:hypothetical protein